MKNFFVDVNILIDLLIDRAPFSTDAAHLFDLAAKKRVTLFVAAVTFNNLYYILRKVIGHDATISKLHQLTFLVVVADVTSGIITQAIESGRPDLEDAIQYFTALSYPKIDAIVTRDVKGFRKSKIALFTPQEALSNI